MIQTHSYGHRLRAMLIAVVTLNLVFVHLTGAVGLRWLVPLYALTLGASLLARLQRSLLYRAGWNLSVLLIFALLVHHASRGVHFLLEDGLMLAAFCQVHLLNNLERQQKPDLLFFNSFLIALVTSFFCQDLAFAAVFIVFVPVFMVGLQMALVDRHGDGGLRRDGFPAGMLGDVLKKAAVILLCTGVGFVVLPRDFTREGLVTTHLLRSAQARSAFSEEVELGHTTEMALSDRVVLRMRLSRGRPLDVPALWRGATFDRFVAGRWRTVVDEQGFATSTGEKWVRRSDQNVYRPNDDLTAQVVVHVDDPSASRLFCPLDSHGVRVDAATATAYVGIRTDGTLGIVRAADEPAEFTYDVDLHRTSLAHGRETRHPRGSLLREYFYVAADALPPAAVRRANRISRELATAPQVEVVEALRTDLVASREYLLPGADGAAENLRDFLLNARGGHCEYFATALALLLRTQGVPTRLVTGYLCTEWSEEERELIVRARHAHAWVEVKDPEGFWYAVDPTPSMRIEETTAEGFWSHLIEDLKAAWAALTGFDASARARTLEQIAAWPGRCLAATVAYPLRTALLVLTLVAGVWWLRRRLRRRHPVTVLAYRTALKDCGLTPHRGETPRELLRRAGGLELAAERLARLRAAVTAHEAERYARPG